MVAGTFLPTHILVHARLGQQFRRRWMRQLKDNSLGRVGAELDCVRIAPQGPKTGQKRGAQQRRGSHSY